jgi:hypothetical protein
MQEGKDDGKAYSGSYGNELWQTWTFFSEGYRRSCLSGQVGSGRMLLRNPKSSIELFHILVVLVMRGGDQASRTRRLGS